MRDNKSLLHTYKKKKIEQSSIFNDKLWYYFFISNDNWNKMSDFHGKDSDKIANCINKARKRSFTEVTAPCIKVQTVNPRTILKDYYDRNSPIFWVATAGDISLPKGRQAGNLLLYHLAIEKRNREPNLINIGYDIQAKNVQAIDHHAWLRVSDIKYFGNKDHCDISYGDVIFGTSLIKKYTDKNGNDAYTLGATIIRQSGFIQGEEVIIDDNNYDPYYLTSKNAKVVDYNHAGNEMLRLGYTKKALQKIRKMRSLNIQELANSKYYLTTIYKKSHTYNYHDLIRNKQVTQLDNLPNEQHRSINISTLPKQSLLNKAS